MSMMEPVSLTTHTGTIVLMPPPGQYPEGAERVYGQKRHGRMVMYAVPLILTSPVVFVLAGMAAWAVADENPHSRLSHTKGWFARIYVTIARWVS